jgi:hypothetical protein
VPSPARPAPASAGRYRPLDVPRSHPSLLVDEELARRVQPRRPYRRSRPANPRQAGRPRWPAQRAEFTAFQFFPGASRTGPELGGRQPSGSLPVQVGPAKDLLDRQWRDALAALPLQQAGERRPARQAAPAARQRPVDGPPGLPRRPDDRAGPGVRPAASALVVRVRPAEDESDGQAAGGHRLGPGAGGPQPTRCRQGAEASRFLVGVDRGRGGRRRRSTCSGGSFFLRNTEAVRCNGGQASGISHGFAGPASAVRKRTVTGAPQRSRCPGLSTRTRTGTRPVCASAATPTLTTRPAR